MIPAMPREDMTALVRELRAAGATALADRLEPLGAGPAAQAFRQAAERFARFLLVVGQKQPAAVGEVLRQWMPELIARSASMAIAQLADQARELLGSRELAAATKTTNRAALEARQNLESMAALKQQAAELRRFEESAARLDAKWKGNWDALGADLLRQFDVK